MQDLHALLVDPVLQSLWLMLAVIVAERAIPWPDKYHPLTLFRLFAERLGTKVNPGAESGHQQQLISGSLGLIVLILPVIGLSAVLIGLAEYPLFFEGILLLIALQYESVVNQYRRMMHAIGQRKKTLAREQLSAFVLRETKRLSDVGIAKASIESLLLRVSHQYCTVLFWYLVAGGLGALTYRLIFTCAQVWNGKLPAYNGFARPASFLARTLQWMPSRLCALCLAISVNLGQALSSFKARPERCMNQTSLLAMFGGALSIELGGPAYYEGQKVRFPKVGGKREVKFADLGRAMTAMRRSQAVFITLCSLTIVFFYALKLSL